MEERTYKFLTDKIEIRSDPKEKVYKVIGYATLRGNKVDLKKSIITENAKEQMRQMILQSDVAVDIEHDAVATGRENLLPVAKTKFAEWDDNGLKLETHLNPYSPQFHTTWGSLKGGFLDAYSVEFIPKKVSEQFIEGEWIKVIDSVELRGIAFTGRSATLGTNILEVMSYSIIDFNKEEMEVRNEMKGVKMEQNNEIKPAVIPEIKGVTQEQVDQIVSKRFEEVKKKEDAEVAAIEKEEKLKEQSEELERIKKELQEIKDKNLKPNAQSIVKQEDKYGQLVNAGVPTQQKSSYEQLREKPLRELMQQAIETKAFMTRN